MIIKISQTSARLKPSYDIYIGDIYYQGKLGGLSRLQPISLASDSSALKGVFSLSRWYNYIRPRCYFGKENITRIFHIYKNDGQYGKFYFSLRSPVKSCYVISLNSGEVFHCYTRSINSFDYISIYQGRKQIALVETNLSMYNNIYTHKLYILDDYNSHAETLSLFVMYYASYRFTQRFNTMYGSVTVKSYSFSHYNDRYDPKWRETNFPDEDYFGKSTLDSIKPLSKRD